jgi:nicotinamide mononucleotide adenylyltransferase
MPAPGNEDQPIHWGHVGDVNRINSQLSEIVSFIEGSL